MCAKEFKATTFSAYVGSAKAFSRQKMFFKRYITMFIEKKMLTVKMIKVYFCIKLPVWVV